MITVRMVDFEPQDKSNKLSVEAADDGDGILIYLQNDGAIIIKLSEIDELIKAIETVANSME